MPDVALVVEKLRDVLARAIAQQPVSVAIHRVQQVSDGAGGYTTVVLDLPPFTGRLRPSNRVVQTRQTVAGTMQVAGWTLLAPASADLKQSATVTDTFTLADGRSFQIVQIKKISYAGETIGIEAECVELQ